MDRVNLRDRPHAWETRAIARIPPAWPRCSRRPHHRPRPASTGATMTCVSRAAGYRAA